MPISVLVAEDNSFMREAISRLLRSDPENLSVLEAISFSQMVQLATMLCPQIVVMDLHMGDEGAVTPEQIKVSLAGCHLIAISLAHDDAAKTLADSFGAEILLDKMNLAAELIPTIKRCVKD